jgi:hypothetical protein
MIVDVRRGSLTLTLSQREREQKKNAPTHHINHDAQPTRIRLLLREYPPHCSLSLRERAGVRAARSFIRSQIPTDAGIWIAFRQDR